MALGSIVVRLTMNTADFETDARRASNEAQRRAKEIDAAFKKAGAAIGVALGAGAIAATAAIKNTINRMDDMSKASQKVGLPTEEFSRLAYAGGLADVEMDTLASTLGKLTKAQAAALKDTSEQARVFQALGIAVTDANGKMRDSSAILLEFADRFAAMEGSPEAMAAGFSLFGRSFQDMVPLIKDGSAAIREAMQESDALGNTLSTEAGQAAEEFNDNLTRLQTAVGGVWQEIASGMLPQLNAMTGELVYASKETDNLRQFGEGLVTVLGAIGKAFGFVAGMARQMGTDAATAVQALSGWAEITKNIATFGFANGSIAGGVKTILDAGKTRKEMMEAQRQAEAMAKTRANIDRILAGATGKYTGPALAPSRMEVQAAKTDWSSRLAAALSGTPKVPKAKSGKSDAEKMAEEAARAAREAEEAQRRWNSTILDMEARMAGPAAEANREYARSAAEISAEYLAGNVTLADYAKGLELYAAARDKELKAIADRKSPAEEMLADMQFEASLIGKTREEQELLTAARYLGIEAMTAQGQAALDAMKANQEAAKSARDQISIMDEWRQGSANALADFVTGAKSAGDALRDFFDDMARMITQMIAERWMQQLFGQMGSSQTGSMGGGLFSMIAGLFGGGGYASGGYTGAGGVSQPAGIVHRGEVVWSQGDVARAGGVAAVEAMRRGMGGGTVANVNQTFVVQGTPDRMTRQQLASKMGNETTRAMRRM